MSNQRQYLLLVLLTIYLSIDLVDSGLIGWAIPDEHRASWTILLKPRQRRGFMDRKPNALAPSRKVHRFGFTSSDHREPIRFGKRTLIHMQ